MKRWACCCVAIGLVAMFSGSAAAVPLGQGVQWAFEGTVIEASIPATSLQPWCCGQLGDWQVGKHVTGTIEQFYSTPEPSYIPAYYYAAASFDGFGIQGAVSPTFGAVPVDGAPGSPDRFEISGPGGIDLHMGAAPFYITQTAQLLLVDMDGTAWTSPLNARAPLLLPDFAPDISQFETAELSITSEIRPNVPDIGLPSATITIKVRIDSFQVPEAALFGLESLLLGVLAARAAAQKIV